MAKKVRGPIGPFVAEELFFSKGKDRKIEFTLYPKYIEIRLVGEKGTYHVPYGVIVVKGAEMERTPRIKRGVL